MQIFPSKWTTTRQKHCIYQVDPQKSWLCPGNQVMYDVGVYFGCNIICVVILAGIVKPFSEINWDCQLFNTHYLICVILPTT